MTPVTLTTPDAVQLSGTWFPARSPQATVVLAGAFAVKQRFYARLADTLAQRGLNVLTLDYRGIGASRGGSLVASPATLRDWGENDLGGALDAAEVLGKGTPLVWLAHSFGGQALGLAPTEGRLRGALTLCSAFGSLRHWPTTRRLQYQTQMTVGSAISQQYGYLPGWAGLGEDVPKGVFLEWARWCRSEHYLVDHVPGAREVFASVRVPTQLWFTDDDPMAPRAAVEALGAWMPHSTVRAIASEPYGGLGHFGIIKKETGLWGEIADTLLGFTGAASLSRAG